MIVSPLSGAAGQGADRPRQPQRRRPHPLRRASVAPRAPILDWGQRQTWLRRLPARLGTPALGLGSLSLFGPRQQAGLLALNDSLLPSALGFDQLRRQGAATPQRLLTLLTSQVLPWSLAWAELAELV